MKKILSFFFFSFIILSSAIAQTFQATIKNGSAPNSVYIVIKPSANTTGQISSIQFALAVPKTISATMPGYSITSLITGLDYGGIQTSEEVADGILSYVYTFGGVGASGVPTVNYVAGTEYTLAEVFLSGDPSITTAVKLIQLPDGGTTSNSNFYFTLGGLDVVNTTEQFYGTGAVNDGQGYSGTSYAIISNVNLPVKFLSFFAIKNGDNAKLSWTVANDKDNSYFDLERSPNGKDFTSFARVNALDNGKNTNSYEATDGVLSKHDTKNLYYRIKQTDKNGSTSYSVIRYLNIAQSLAVSLYPNPTRSTAKLVVDAPAAGKASIVVRDITGKRVQVLNVELIKGINQKDINVSSLASGDYNVSVIAEGLNQTIKLSRVN